MGIDWERSQSRVVTGNSYPDSKDERQGIERGQTLLREYFTTPSVSCSKQCWWRCDSRWPVSPSVPLPLDRWHGGSKVWNSRQLHVCVCVRERERERERGIAKHYCSLLFSVPSSATEYTVMPKDCKCLQMKFEKSNKEMTGNYLFLPLPLFRLLTGTISHLGELWNSANET